MAKDSGKEPLTMVPSDPNDLEEQIRRRAYELYEERGREDGHDVDDWLHAEAEINKMKETPIAA